MGMGKMKRFMMALIVALCGAATAQSQDVSWDDCLSGQRGGLAVEDFTNMCNAIKAARADERAAREADVTLRKTEADAAKAEADAQKARNDAAIAEKFAEAEKLKDLTPEFDPDKSGGVELKDGAGKIEGELLAAVASHSAAQQVCKGALHDDKLNGQKLFVKIAGSTDPGTANVLYEFHLSYLAKLSDEAGEKAATTADQLQALSDLLDDAGAAPEIDGKNGDPATAFAGGAETALMSVQAIGGTLAGFAQLFATEFQVGGFDVDGFDELFIAQVAGCMTGGENGPTLYTRESLALLVGSGQQTSVLSTLTDKRDTLDAMLSVQAEFAQHLKTSKARLEQISKPENGSNRADLPDDQKALIAEIKLALKQAEASNGAFATAVAAYKKSYDDLLTALSTLDGPLAMSELLKAKAYIDADFTQFLELKIDAAGGSYYTKKNIWSTLGDMPFEIAGGAVVHYTFFNRGGQVLAADSIQVHSGYYEVNDIASGSTVSPQLLQTEEVPESADRTAGGASAPLASIRR